MSEKHGGSPEFPYYTDKQEVPVSLPPQQSKVPVIKSEYWTAKDGTIQEWCAECGYEKFHKVTCSKSTAALAGETRTKPELKFLTSSMDKVHGNPYFAYGDGTRYDIRILHKGTGYWSEPNELDLKRLTALAAAESRIAQERDAALQAVIPYAESDYDAQFVEALHRAVGLASQNPEVMILLRCMKTTEAKLLTAEAALTQAQAELKEYRDADRMRKNQ